MIRSKGKIVLMAEINPSLTNEGKGNGFTLWLVGHKE